MTTISHLDGVANFRDCGGLPLKNGGETRQGILYRSADLAGITDRGLEELVASDIGVIVDLRTVSEREFQPDKVPLTRPFDQLDLPLQTGNLNPDAMMKHFPGAGHPDLARMSQEQLADLAQQFEKSIPSFDDMYLSLLTTGAQTFAQVARLTAQYQPGSDNAVLVHCTAGKDRTGVSCALILDAVGVQRDAVIAHYAQSQDNLAGPWAENMVAQVAKIGIPMVPQLVSIMTKTPPEAIQNALAWVDENHGGAANYLRSGGLSESDLDRLQSLFTN